MAKIDRDRSITVNGFTFSDADEIKKAQKEVEGIKYIKEKTNMDDPEMVLEIYNHMVRRNLFETAVGLAYLKELQEYLQSIPYLKEESILPIPVLKQKNQTTKQSLPIRQNQKPIEKKTPSVSVNRKEKNVDFKSRFQISFIINIALLICILGMYLVNLSTNLPTILNYETKIIDKYEHWEQELEAREAELNAKGMEADVAE